MALAIVGCACACARTPPEQALRDTIAQLQRDIGARDADAVTSVLAEDFVGNEGMDRRGARQLAAGTFLRYREVGAKLGPLQVEMRGDRHATVRFTAAISGGAGLVPQEGQVYQVVTGWRLVDGDWMLTSADWTPAL
ncbi:MULTISPECIES: nuclear transport factor 2 family protein [unclassified Lysobacter]|uniref:nuclear transport factor 2 family protein n=1 Tax=unclassified Lysobacter TaxID=2635362 RepID=UPI001F593C44|nr:MULTISPECIES: nuclear transport factor 2 family protein [unclassified Lysobacter]